MSATRPAIEFSIGIMASAARPSRTAAKASSKVARRAAVQRPDMSRAWRYAESGARLALEARWLSGHLWVLS